jgi:nucleoside-specific outer membrane channel protein Tsx
MDKLLLIYFLTVLWSFTFFIGGSVAIYLDTLEIMGKDKNVIKDTFYGVFESIFRLSTIVYVAISLIPVINVLMAIKFLFFLTRAKNLVESIMIQENLQDLIKKEEK